MDFNRLTIKSGEAVAGAQEPARRLGQPELCTSSTCRSRPRPGARTLVEPCRRRAAELRSEAEAALRQAPRAAATCSCRRAPFRRVLDKAFEEMQVLGDEFVLVEHLLLAPAGASRRTACGAAGCAAGRR